MFLLHFSRFKTFLFLGHSKIKVRSCVLCVYAGTPLTAACAVKYGQIFICICVCVYAVRSIKLLCAHVYIGFSRVWA